MVAHPVEPREIRLLHGVQDVLLGDDGDLGLKHGELLGLVACQRQVWLLVALSVLEHGDRLESFRANALPLLNLPSCSIHRRNNCIVAIHRKVVLVIIKQVVSLTLSNTRPCVDSTDLSTVRIPSGHHIELRRLGVELLLEGHDPASLAVGSLHVLFDLGVRSGVLHPVLLRVGARRIGQTLQQIEVLLVDTRSGLVCLDLLAGDMALVNGS